MCGYYSDKCATGCCNVSCYHGSLHTFYSHICLTLLFDIAIEIALGDAFTVTLSVLYFEHVFTLNSGFCQVEGFKILEF